MDQAESDLPSIDLLAMTSSYTVGLHKSGVLGSVPVSSLPMTTSGTLSISGCMSTGSDPCQSTHIDRPACD